jgi:hypothetical protein
MSISDEQKRQQYLSWLDQQIRALIGNGDVSHLPNAGRKFDWSQESPHTPEDLRLAYKIMRDADVVPEWIALSAELEKERSAIERLAQQVHRDYRLRQAEADRRGSLVLRREADARRTDALRRLSQQIVEYNRKLLIFNLTRPKAVAQRVPLNIDEIMRAAEDAN